MLPRPQRLRTGREISHVSRAGGRARSGDLVVSLVVRADPAVLAPSTPLASAVLSVPAVPFRAAVVVGKPVGDAVARNRLRRRIRHALADLCADGSTPRDSGGDIPGGSDIVIRSGPGTAALSPIELRAELRSAVARAARRTGTSR